MISQIYIQEVYLQTLTAKNELDNRKNILATKISKTVEKDGKEGEDKAKDGENGGKNELIQYQSVTFSSFHRTTTKGTKVPAECL